MMLSTIRRHGVPAARCLVSQASLFPRNEVFSQRSRSTGNKKECFDKFAALDDNKRAACVLDLEYKWKILKNLCPVEAAWMMDEKVDNERSAEKVKERSTDNKRKYPTVAEEWKSFENLRANCAEWWFKCYEAREFSKFETMNQNERASYVLYFETTCKRMEIDPHEEFATTDEKKAELRTEKIKTQIADNKFKHATIEEEWKSFENLRAAKAEWAIRSIEAEEFDKFAVLDRNERAAYILDFEFTWKHREIMSEEYSGSDEKKAELRAEKIKKRVTHNKRKYATLEEEWNSFENLRVNLVEWVTSLEEEQMSLAVEEIRYSWHLYFYYMMMFSGCCGVCVVMGSL